MPKDTDAVVIGGLGVVGTATRRMLGIRQYCDIKSSHPVGPLNTAFYPITDARYIFLCLPTPTLNGRCDLTAIRSYFAGYKADHIYIIRSTVPPGTARELSLEFGVHVVSNPEFLTGATADQEALHPDLLVLGADYEFVLDEVWCRFYQHVNADRVVFTDTKTAEFVKYAINAFYASKVLFANVLFDVARDLGIDYDTVRDAMYARKWIGDNHLTVPWKGERGLNGRCLPKDLAAFASFTDDPFFKFLVALNKRLLIE